MVYGEHPKGDYISESVCGGELIGLTGNEVYKPVEDVNIKG